MDSRASDGGSQIRPGQWRYCESCNRCHPTSSKSCMLSDTGMKPRFYARDAYSPSKPEYGEEEPAEDPQEDYERDKDEDQCWRDEQKHVHEFQGSTKLAEFDEDVHNHRFAGISGEAIKIRGSHIHKIWTRTDYFDHFHFICKFTGPAIPVDVDEEDDCDDKYGKRKKKVEKHIHYVEGFTNVEDEHRHGFEFATLIESPLLPEFDPE